MPASQAGRRRFESGRPLSEEVFDSESDASGCRRISTSFAPPAYVIRLRRNNPVEGNVAPPNTAALPFLRYPCDTQLFPCWPGSHWRQSRVRIDHQSVPPLTREPARPRLQPRLRDRGQESSKVRRAQARCTLSTSRRSGTATRST